MSLDSPNVANPVELAKIFALAKQGSDAAAYQAELNDIDSQHREILPVASSGRAFRAMISELKVQKWLVAQVLITSTGNAGLGTLVTLLIGRLINAVQAGESTQTLVYYSISIATLGAISGLLMVLLWARIGVLGQAILVKLREDVMFKALNLPAARLEKGGSGDALSRVADDVNQANTAVKEILPAVTWCVASILFSFAGLFTLDWRLAIAALCSVPLYAMALRWYLPRSRPLYARERKVMGSRAQALIGGISGLPTIQAYGVERAQQEGVDRHSRIAAATMVQVSRLVGRVPIFFSGAESLGTILILITGFWLFTNGQTTVGTVTAGAIFFYQLFWPLQWLVWMSDGVQVAGASLVRIVGVIDMPLDAEPSNPQKPLDASLSVHHVSHEYHPGRPVVHPVDLHIEPGETVAIVGASGAGKTTLAAIVAGTLVPTQGEVRYGGAPLSSMGAVARRKHVALLSQEVHVFKGSLAEDLRLARSTATDDDLWGALRHVEADTWVRALPDGLETMIGEKGQKITPEQAQHLALARVVLADPAIIIMDEATADAGSDQSPGENQVGGGHAIERAASLAAAGRTTIVIAHRLAQAAAADRIIVMQQGRIVEQGAHDELVQGHGVYAGLWAAWSK